MELTDLLQVLTMNPGQLGGQGSLWGALQDFSPVCLQGRGLSAGHGGPLRLAGISPTGCLPR